MIVIFSNPEGLSVSVNVEAIRSTEESLFLADSEEEFIINRDELKQIFTDYDVFNYSDGITLTQFKQDFLRESMPNMPKTNSTLQWTLGDIPKLLSTDVKFLMNDIINFITQNPQDVPRFIDIQYTDKLVINHNFTQERVLDMIGSALFLQTQLENYEEFNS